MANAVGDSSDFKDTEGDLNPPKPTYFYDVYHLVHAYIVVVKNVAEGAIPSKGMVTLYSYRSGTLNLDTQLLQDYYAKRLTTDLQQVQNTQAFGQSSICNNILTLYRLLSNTLTTDICRGFGNDFCLTSELVHALNVFSKLQVMTAPAGARMRLQDTMNEVIESCRYNAYYPQQGVSSAQAILRCIEALDNIMADPQPRRDISTRQRLLNCLEILFLIGCAYYKLNFLRFSDEVIHRSYDRNLAITDFTLAAVPFDPTLIYACSDDSVSISRWGIEYLQALEAVLIFGGGVRYPAVLAIEANGNKGVGNV